MVNCQKVFCLHQMPEKCTWCHNIPVIDSIYYLIKFFSLFGSLTFIMILRDFLGILNTRLALIRQKVMLLHTEVQKAISL